MTLGQQFTYETSLGELSFLVSLHFSNESKKPRLLPKLEKTEVRNLSVNFLSLNSLNSGRVLNGVFTTFFEEGQFNKTNLLGSVVISESQSVAIFASTEGLGSGVN